MTTVMTPHGPCAPLELPVRLPDGQLVGDVTEDTAKRILSEGYGEFITNRKGGYVRIFPGTTARDLGRWMELRGQGAPPSVTTKLEALGDTGHTALAHHSRCKQWHESAVKRK